MNSSLNIPDDSDFLSTTPHIQQRYDEFKAAWNSDDHPVIENFLSDVEGKEREQLIRGLVALEVQYRIRQGETPQLAEYTPRYRCARKVTFALNLIAAFRSRKESRSKTVARQQHNQLESLSFNIG